MTFHIEMKTGYLEIKLEEDTTADDETLFKQRIDFEFKKKSFDHILVDCSNLKTLGNKILQALAQLSKDLKKGNKRGGVRFYNMNDRLQAVLKTKGLDSALPQFKSIRGALSDAGLESTKTVDVGLINPLISSVVTVIESQSKMKSTFDKPYVKKKEDTKKLGDVSSIIQIRSEVFEGALTLNLSESVFKILCEKMNGKACSGIIRENIDVVGKLSEVIIKHAKIELHKTGYQIESYDPVVLLKDDSQPKFLSKEMSTVVVPFKCDAGAFYIEISTAVKKAPSAPKGDKAA